MTPRIIKILLGVVFCAIVLIGIVENWKTSNTPIRKVGSSGAKAILEAQEIYHRTDYDNDGVLEYATNLQQLYETKPGTGDIALIDRATAKADATLPNPQPKVGYLFKILTAAGLSAQCGKTSFIKDGNLVLAHAVLAYPALTNDVYHHEAYLICSDGILYEKWLGTDPMTAAQSIHEFNPDSSWKRSE
jgi:hypothetical protein